MLLRMWSTGNSFSLLTEVQTCLATLEINMEVCQKIENRSFSRPSYATPDHMPKGLCILPQAHLLNYVHSSFIHNNQNLKTTLSLNQRIDKENVHLHSGVLLSC